jgi:two-component system chemotaxis sensor kinase CheA
MDSILRPLVESAGYTVVASGAPGSEAASVVITSAEAGEAPSPGGARQVRVRASADAGRDDGSIHRYDREALLAALAGEAPARRRRRRG